MVKICGGLAQGGATIIECGETAPSAKGEEIIGTNKYVIGVAGARPGTARAEASHRRVPRGLVLNGLTFPEDATLKGRCSGANLQLVGVSSGGGFIVWNMQGLATASPDTDKGVGRRAW